MLFYLKSFFEFLDQRTKIRSFKQEKKKENLRPDDLPEPDWLANEEKVIDLMPDCSEAQGCLCG